MLVDARPFSELVDLNDIRRLLEAHHAMTGMPIGITDAGGTIIFQLGWFDPCDTLHQGNGRRCEGCHVEDPAVGAKLRAGDIAENRCRHLLRQWSIPIRVNGTLIASLIFGRFFYESDTAPDEDAFGRFRETPGGDTWAGAVARVKRIPAETAEKNKFYHIVLANLLTDIATKNLLLEEELAHSAEAIAALRESEQRFSEALSTSRKHLLYRRNLHANGYDYVSPAAAEFFGVSPQEMATNGQQVVWNAIHPDDRPSVKAALDGIPRDRPPQLLLEYRIRGADGDYHWFSDSNTVLYNAKGEAEALVGVAQDISRRKRVEMELAETRAATAEAFSQNPNGMILAKAPEQTIILANATATGLLGIRTEELPPLLAGTPLACLPNHWQLLRSDGSPIPREEWPLTRALQGIATPEEECRIRRADGTERWVLMRGTPVCGNGGTVTAGLLTIEDISVRREAEAALQRMETRLQQTQKLESIGVLAGGIAHDFNNLLMTICGNQELLAVSLPADSPMQRYLRDMTQACRRAADICRQMLAYSGKGQNIIQKVNVSEMVTGIHGMLKIAIGKSTALDLRLADNLPPVEADASQIQQVIMNLVQNAAEAIGESTAGTITVSTLLEKDKKAGAGSDVVAPAGQIAAGPYAGIEVVDNGSGMSEAVLSRVFEPFYSTKFVGRGLGLPAVYGIVRSHKGFIRLQSEPGKGSRIAVYFPAAARPRKSASKPASAIIPQADGWHGSGTILLVDDEQAVRDIGRRMLEHLGFRVLTAENGPHAVQIFQDNLQTEDLPDEDRIVCILLDQSMPVLDGMQTLVELKKIRLSIPVILCSGYSETDLERSFAGKGLAGVVQKPYGLDLLQTKLRQALE
jgi:PAS domain S-box-containing protein